MRTFYGKNGCYDFEEVPDGSRWALSIYLNSPIVYEHHDVDDKFVRSAAQERDIPEVEFFIDKDGEEWYINEMTIYGLGMDGVNEFASALLAKIDGTDKNDLVKSVESLLEEDGAPWGIVHPDTEE